MIWAFQIIGGPFDGATMHIEGEKIIDGTFKWRGHEYKIIVADNKVIHVGFYDENSNTT